MKTFYFTFLSVIFLNGAQAQGSMMEDVSIPYLDRLVELGKANFPKFKYAIAKVGSAKAAYDKTKYGFFDFVTLSYIYLPENYSVYNNNGAYNAALSGYQLGVFLNVGSFMQKPSIIRGAKEEYVAAKFDKDVMDMDLEQEIRKRYFIYVEQSNIMKLKTKAMGDADGVLKDMKYKFEKGEVTMEIYSQALLSFSIFSEQKIAAESSFLIAKTSLEEIVGTKLENIK